MASKALFASVAHPIPLFLMREMMNSDWEGKYSFSDEQK